jgi:SOS-response transcriptional repressor LexA
MANDIEDAPAQRKLLEAILDRWDRGERVPTYQELADELGIVRSRIHSSVNILIRKGYLECIRTPLKNVKTGSIIPTNKARQWWSRSRSDRPTFEPTLTEVTDTRFVEVPGTVAAGIPIPAQRNASEEDSNESLQLPAQNVRRSDIFMLEVGGDSMAGDDLLKGDHIIVDPHARWTDGDMVVVLSRGEATVKRLWHEDESIYLESSNPEYEPIILEPGSEHLGEHIIQGKVIGVVLWHVKPGRRNSR